MNEEIILRGRIQLASKTESEWNAVESGNLVLLDGEGIIVKQLNNKKIVFGNGINNINDTPSYITFGSGYGSLSIEAPLHSVQYKVNNQKSVKDITTITTSQCQQNNVEVIGAFTIGSANNIQAAFGIGLGMACTVTAPFALAQGWNTTAGASGGHAQGSYTQVYDNYGHAEGSMCVIEVGGLGGHAEGNDTHVYAKYGHTEGNNTKVYATYGHAEGIRCQVMESGLGGHAEGQSTKVTAPGAHAGGYGSIASSYFGLVHGIFCNTKENTDIRDNVGQTVLGRGGYGDGALIVGISKITKWQGDTAYPDYISDKDKKNGFVVDWNGNGWFAKNVAASTAPTADDHLTNKKYVDDAVSVEKIRAEAKEQELDTRIDDIDTLLRATINDGDPSDLDSVIDLINWVKNHGIEAASMSQAITKNTQNIATNTSDISTLSAKVEYLLVGPITINSLTIDGAASGLYHKGVAVDVNIEWETNHKPPKTLVLKDNKNNILTNDNNLTQYNASAIQENTIYTLTVTDIMDKIASKTVAVNFGNDILYGVNNAETLDDISVLNKDLTAYRHITKTYTPENQYIYYSYPSAMGNANFNVGGFDGGFDYIGDKEYINEAGYTETYKVYRSTNKLDGSIKVVVS